MHKARLSTPPSWIPGQNSQLCDDGSSTHAGAWPHTATLPWVLSREPCPHPPPTAVHCHGHRLGPGQHWLSSGLPRQPTRPPSPPASRDSPVPVSRGTSDPVASSWSNPELGTAWLLIPSLATEFSWEPEPLLLPSSRTSVPTAWDVPQVSGRKERGSSSPGCLSASSPRIPGHTAHRVPGTGPGACCTPKSPSLEVSGHRSPKEAKAGKSKPIRPSPTSWPGKGPPKASSSPGPSGCPAEDEIGTPNPSLCRWPA